MGMETAGRRDEVDDGWGDEGRQRDLAGPRPSSLDPLTAATSIEGTLQVWEGQGRRL
jgi:hypothetical protein